jgi:hypothetical protein
MKHVGQRMPFASSDNQPNLNAAMIVQVQRDIVRRIQAGRAGIARDFGERASNL